MIVFLIGFRGSGKTTIAPLLAERLDCPWLDVDEIIQQTTGQSIVEIFEEAGEAGFRQVESEVIQRVIQDHPADARLVLSLGGGAIMHPQTREAVAEHGPCIWLRAPVHVLWERIEDDRDNVPRPALTDLDPLEEIHRLLAVREPVYADCADYDIDTSQFNAQQVADQIVQWCKQDDTR